MSQKTYPFKESRRFASPMPNVLTQTLIRATNVWAYRMYSRNTVRLAVESFLPTIDVWRCFDFLNYVPNMVPVAEEVLRGGKIFSPAISFTESPETTDAYYLKVLREIVALCGGTKDIVLVIKDMAGVGSPARVRHFVDACLQKYPDLIIVYHRHSTDGLVMPAMAAAEAGAKLFDVTDDAFSRSYGHPPLRPLVRYLQRFGLQDNNGGRQDLPRYPRRADRQGGASCRGAAAIPEASRFMLFVLGFAAKSHRLLFVDVDTRPRGGLMANRREA